MRLPAVFRTSVFQLTMLYVVLFGVSVATIGWFIYRSTVDLLVAQTDEVIEAEVNGLAEQFNRYGPERLLEIIDDRRERQTSGERFIYYLADRNGNCVLQACNLEEWPAGDMVEGVIEFGLRLRDTPEVEPTPVRAWIRPIVPYERTGYRVLVGREIRELQQIIERFVHALTLGLGLTMLLALGGGLALAFSAQRRVAILSRTTRRIIEGDLSQRVPVDGSHDEHAELAQSVNAMLDQIEGLMGGVRHVGDSIAHDLRGPLTRLRTRLERLADENTPSREQIEECLEQADGVLATFNALLRIARVETGSYRSAFATVDLGPIVADVADLYEATAEEQLVELRRRIVDGAFVFGDRELLAQALTNLVDNALKHTPVGGHVDLEIRRVGERIKVVVADSGPGIPPAARERVLQRFARLDESRSRPGNGLGLALVRAVADQHDAELVLTDNAPGLRVTLNLPAAPQPADDEQEKTRLQGEAGPRSASSKTWQPAGGNGRQTSH